MRNSISEKIKTPVGMTGLAVEPWRKGEIYAVAAADWSDAASPIMQYHAEGVWGGTQYQVGSFGQRYGHSDEAALETILWDAVEDGGGDMDAIMADAVAI